jgi:hypothetical protein
MRRLIDSRTFNQAMRGAALVVTDRRWAAPLSAAALGFGIFAGVAIGPGTAGTLATGARQIIEIPASSEGDGQSGGGGAVASTGSPPPVEEGEATGFEEAIPPAPLAPEPVEPLPAPAPAPAPKPTPAPEDEKPEGQSFTGTVVHTSAAAGSYAIAIEGGELLAVHAAELLESGTRSKVTLRRLANGTFAETKEPEVEKQTAANVTFRGMVTFVDADPAAPTYTVSGRGSSLPIEVTPDPTGAAPELPVIGSYVEVTANIEESIATPPAKTAAILVESEIEVEPGPPSTYLDLAGTVEEVLPDGRVLFSADWTGEGEDALTLVVPKEVDASKLKAGDSYLATAEIGADGSLTLKGIAGDEHTRGADDPTAAQGDLKR